MKIRSVFDVYSALKNIMSNMMTLIIQWNMRQRIML